jgi:hypothetical protein
MPLLQQVIVTLVKALGNASSPLTATGLTLAFGHVRALSQE